MHWEIVEKIRSTNFIVIANCEISRLRFGDLARFYGNLLIRIICNDPSWNCGCTVLMKVDVLCKECMFLTALCCWKFSICRLSAAAHFKFEEQLDLGVILRVNVLIDVEDLVGIAFNIGLWVLEEVRQWLNSVKHWRASILYYKVHCSQ